MSDYSYTLIDPPNPGWGNLHWKFRVVYSNGASEVIPITNISGQDNAELALRYVVEDEFYQRPQPPEPVNREPRRTPDIRPAAAARWNLFPAVRTEVVP